MTIPAIKSCLVFLALALLSTIVHTKICHEQGMNTKNEFDLGFCIRNRLIYSEQLDRVRADYEHEDAKLPYFSYHLDPNSLSLVSVLKMILLANREGASRPNTSQPVMLPRERFRHGEDVSVLGICLLEIKHLIGDLAVLVRYLEGDLRRRKKQHPPPPLQRLSREHHRRISAGTLGSHQDHKCLR